MKIKLILLASLAIGLFGTVTPISAMAESTQMCEADEEPCTKPAKHFHFAGTSREVSSFFPEVTCDILFLGFTKSGLESSQLLEGKITFSQCNNFCTVKEGEEEGPSEIERSGAELGWWNISARISGCLCGFPHITWHFLGPLNGGGTNGTLTSEDLVDEWSTCPLDTTFDTELESLSPLYIKS